VADFQAAITCEPGAQGKAADAARQSAPVQTFDKNKITTFTEGRTQE